MPYAVARGEKRHASGLKGVLGEAEVEAYLVALSVENITE